MTTKEQLEDILVQLQGALEDNAHSVTAAQNDTRLNQAIYVRVGVLAEATIAILKALVAEKEAAQ